MNPEREQDERRCRRCERAIDETDSFHLWDGNTYCRTCVERAEPKLAAYAREHSSLHDGPVFPAWRVVGKVLLIGWLPFTLVFSSIGVLDGFRKESIEIALVWIGFIQAIFVPVACLFGTVIYAAYSTADWSVEVEEGSVSIGRGGSQIPLDNCQWFVGKMTDATRPLFGPRICAVLLATRPEGALDEVILAVSVDPAMLNVWTGFLTLAGLPRRIIWERRSRTRRATYFAGGFAAVIVAVAATGWLGVQCARLLDGLNTPKEVTEAVMFAFVAPGCILAVFGVAMLWPWSALPRVPSRRSYDEQRRIRRHYLVGGLLTSLISLTYLLNGLLGFITHFAISLAFGAMLGLVVGHWRATRDWATTEEGSATRRDD